jgi:hypothetical protein
MGQRTGSQISDRDREALALLAEHRVMVLPQVAHGLGVAESTASSRLRHLRELRLIGYEAIFRQQPPAAWITRRGLNAIESRLPPPSVDLKGYRHDIGVGWMWLAARDGVFGPTREVIGEREMRSHDLRPGRTAEPFGIALGGLDSYGRMTRHYPDLLITTGDGRRVAFELELTAKSTRRLDTIMRGYGGDGRIDGILYAVPSASLRRLITDAATRGRVSDLVGVRQIADGHIEGAPDPRAVAPGRDATGRGATGRGATGRDATGRDASDRSGSGRGALGRGGSRTQSTSAGPSSRSRGSEGPSR